MTNTSSVTRPHHDLLKTEIFCMSRPFKFDEKPQIVKPAGNYPYYFLERADHVHLGIRII